MSLSDHEQNKNPAKILGKQEQFVNSEDKNFLGLKNSAEESEQINSVSANK